MSKPSLAYEKWTPSKTSERQNIGIIGAGLIGLSTSYATAIQGGGRIKVSLYESSNVGHSEAASTDINRVFRHLHGPDPIMTTWAKEASNLWAHLSAESGNALLQKTGVLFLVHKGTDPSYIGNHVWPYSNAGDWVEDSIRILDDQKVPYRRLTPKQISREFPQFKSTVIEEAIIDEQAGFVEASTAIRSLLSLCLRAGVKYYPNTTVTRIDPTNNGCMIQFSDGTEAHRDAVVVATNGWTSELIHLPSDTLTLSEQPVVYLSPIDESHSLEQGHFPVFISLNTDCYGFPIHSGVMKIANDNPYRIINHPSERQTPSKDYVKQVIHTVANFIPVLQSAKVADYHVCFYDRSKDGNFILDSWDSDARIVFGCGMSGRAFKFGPVIGQRLAQFAMSGQKPKDINDFQIR